MASDIKQQNLRKALASKRRFSLLKRIVRRRKELRKKIKAVFPAQDPIDLSREALTVNTNIIAVDNERSHLLQGRVDYVIGFLALLLIFAIPFMASVREPVGPGALVVFALEIVLWVLWIKFWYSTTRGRINRSVNVAVTSVLPAAACFIPKALVYTGDWRGPEHWLSRSAVEGSFLFSVYLTALWTVALLSSALDAQFSSQLRQRNPHVYLMRALFNALCIIVSKKDVVLGWLNSEDRKLLVAYLEDAARCLEVIPKIIAGGDHYSRMWNEQAYLLRASGIRDLKKWVLLPKAETRDYLDQELRRILQLAAVGDWDGLPQADLKDTSGPWWRRALTLIRSIIIAALPPVAVIVFGANLPQGEFKTYVTAVAWIWALINLLAILDPRFGEKLSAFKDLPSFLPFGRK
jgi:hypothetical protein